MKTTFKPTRLLLEVLLLVALAETLVMMVLPELAHGLSIVAAGLLDVAMLMLLSAPAIYWRFSTALKGTVSAHPLAMAAGKSSLAAWLTAIVQVSGLLLTAGGIWWQDNNLEGFSKSRFEQGAERTETDVVGRLNQSVYGLKGARGAMAASSGFNRQAFRAYVASRDLQTEFPGIRGFGLIQHLQRTQLQRFVANERADGAPDFAVRSSGNAADLYVVKYVEPIASNRAALGFDLGVDPNRRAAVEYAVATGQPTLVTGIELLQDANRSPGLLFLLPVYGKASAATSTEQRQHDLLGILYAPIVASELLGSVSAATDGLIDFELFDGTEANPKALIFDADGMPASAAAVRRSGGYSQRKFVVDKVINVGSRVLTLRIASTPRFDAVQDRSSLLIIGFGGTLLSFLMAVSVWLLAVGRQRAQALASAMTAELDRMAQVVQHTNNAVTITDRELNIVWVNQGFSRITGYRAEEALGQTPGALLGSGKSDPLAIQTLLTAAQKGVSCRVELINRAKDGHEYWVDTEVQPTFDALGQLVGFMEIGTDISQQKQTQLQLEAAIRDARALRETVDTHAIVSVTDADGNITDVNEAFCRISGYSREELLGQNHRLLRSGVQNDDFWAHLWRTIGSGKPWQGVICNQAKDGSLYWVDSMIAPYVGEGGQIEKYVSIRNDVTEQHASAERLRQSEATFSASFEFAASGIGFLSPKGQWLRANPALCEFLGYMELELHELTLRETNHPDEWDTDALQIRRLMAGEIAVYQRAKRYLHRDGRVLWGLASISVVRDGAGATQFIITQIVDITARKRAEDALNVSNALMEESQAIAKVGGWELVLATEQLFWTAETYRILETNPEEFDPTVDAGVSYFVPESRARIEAALQAAMEQGTGYDLELQSLTTKGRQIDVRTTGSATMENGRVVRLSGIFQDITERKQYERSLKDAREKAELATQGKAQFLANMSHEIRTPMNAILGMVRLLQNTELSGRQHDYASKTESAARSLLGLINDILDFSKVEAGKMRLDPQPFALEKLMRELSVILSSNVAASQAEVLYDIDPALPQVLLGDSMRLQQVLINLGGNAVKFTAQGQVVLGLRLLSQDAGVAEIAFSVQDSGIGIAEENQAHIFTGFSQAEASTTRKFGGTGLGLSISQRLVDLMGGTLQLSSALGVGSTFSFTLRLAVLPPALDVLPQPVVAPRRVLLVDQHPVARRLLAQMLQTFGWQVQVADSAEAALTWLASNLQAAALPLDVVYMGWQLPGMDGWAATARLRQLCVQAGCSQPVVVMLSANNREALDQRTQEEQALLNGFLVKPVTAAMLRDAALESNAGSAGLRRSPRSGASQRRLKGMRILVVEDNLINQQVAEELLATEGALVSLAANGRLGVEAIDAAQRGQQFDVVLMDIQMPVLDGFAATRIVRQDLHLADLPIVAMTANASDSDREDCLSAGMNGHVGKPFDLKALVQTLLQLTGFAVPLEAELVLPAPLAALPVPKDLDMQGALARMGGMQQLYQKLSLKFIDSLPGELALIQRAVVSDPAHCAMLAHTLKGTSATLGAMALSEAAAALERCCQQAAPQRQAACAQLRAVAAVALLALQQAVPKPALAAQAERYPAALRVGLQELLQLLQDDDLTALECFAQLRAALEAVPQTLALPLEAALQDMDLVEALRCCRALDSWLSLPEPTDLAAV